MSYAEIKKTINSDFSTPLNEGGVKIVKSVQRGIVNTPSRSTDLYGSVNVTINSVDISKSIVLVKGRGLGSSSGDQSIGKFVNNTTISVSGWFSFSSYEISWQVIEFY